MTSAYENGMSNLQAEDYTQRYPVYTMDDVLAERAARQMCAPADMQRAMDAAREAVTQGAAAMQADFSAANEAALYADQTEDFDAEMCSMCADRPDGITEHYNSATEGHW